MLRRATDGQYELACDLCPESTTLEASSFAEAIDEARELRYRAVKTSDGWEHACPACKEYIGG